jgi:rhodanese-related sulfurtransferase
VIPAAPALDSRGLPIGYPYKPEFELTPREVKAALDRREPALVLIDCRTQEEWDTARIAGAELIPLDQIMARVDDIRDLAEHEGAVVAVHCHHGVRSLRAALALRQLGINAKSMAGGIDLWSIDIDPAIRRY